MMTALATVVDVTKGADGNYVSLSCDQQTSCSHCASQKSCGTGIVSKAIGNKQHLWKLITKEKVLVGQTVEIGLPEKKLIQYASLVYIFPLAMLMLGAGVGELFLAPLLGSGEGATIFCSTLFMAAGIWFARKISFKLQSASEQSVVLLRVLGDTISVAKSVS